MKMVSPLGQKTKPSVKYRSLNVLHSISVKSNLWCYYRATETITVIKIGLNLQAYSSYEVTLKNKFDTPHTSQDLNL